jgi:hypothetical protein
MEQSPWEAVSQLVKEFPIFMETEGSLPCSQGPVTGPYPERYATAITTTTNNKNSNGNEQ